LYLNRYPIIYYINTAC